MNPVFLLVAILLPILGSLPVLLVRFKSRKAMTVYVETVVLATSMLVWGILAKRPQEAVPVVKFVNNLSLSLRLDGCGMVFSGLISFLWPLATLYAFEYMKKERRERFFFTFFTY